MDLQPRSRAQRASRRAVQTAASLGRGRGAPTSMAAPPQKLGDLKVELKMRHSHLDVPSISRALAASGTLTARPSTGSHAGRHGPGRRPGTGKGRRFSRAARFRRFHPDNALDARGLLSMANKARITHPEYSTFHFTFGASECQPRPRVLGLRSFGMVGLWGSLEGFVCGSSSASSEVTIDGAGPGTGARAGL